MKNQKKDEFNLAESIKKGLEQAMQYQQGMLKARKKTYKIEPLPHYLGKEVKNIRKKIGYTQQSFSLLIGVSKKTVEGWEAGRSEPNGAAQRIMNLLKQDNKLPEKYGLVQIN